MKKKAAKRIVIPERWIKAAEEAEKEGVELTVIGPPPRKGKPRVKTFKTIKEDGWTWKSVYRTEHKPWADSMADLIRDEFGLHVMLKSYGRMPNTVYHVFVPEQELAPIPGILARWKWNP